MRSFSDAACKGSTLQPGDSLHPNDFLLSPNGAYYLTLQTDGNLVVYRTAGDQPVWAYREDAFRKPDDDRPGRLLAMQPDGNLVLYAKPDQARDHANSLWETNTAGSPGAWATLLDNGHLVVRQEQGPAAGRGRLWQNFTDRRHWMETLSDALPLKDACVPGSHDAGMYKTSFTGGIGARDLALTHSRSLYEQLCHGSRYFDLRLNYYHDGEYYPYHNIVDGPNLGELLADVKRFYDEGSAETVILNFSHWKDFPTDARQAGARKAFVDYLLFHLAKSPTETHLLQVPYGTALREKPLRELRGKIIVLLDDGEGKAIYEQAVKPYHTLGIYSRNVELEVHEKYADKRDYQEMLDDQAGKFQAYTNDKMLFLLNWTLTPIDNIMALVRSSVKSYAKDVNGHLADDARTNKQGLFGRNDHGRMVNIINLDFQEFTDAVPACLRVVKRCKR